MAGLKYTPPRLPPDAYAVAGSETFDGHAVGDEWTQTFLGSDQAVRVRLMAFSGHLYLVPVEVVPGPGETQAAPQAPQPVTEALAGLQHALGVDLPANLANAHAATRSIRQAVQHGR